MKDTMAQVTVLKGLSTEELFKKYEELFGDKKAPSNNKTYLWRKIAYKLQELEYGGLAGKAKDRLKVLIEEYDPINNKALRPDRPVAAQPTATKDKRLPIPGTVITKEYKGSSYKVKVLEKGFEYNGKIYKSLTAIAYEITDAHWNGYLFFGL